jgi:hypothetical protein
MFTGPNISTNGLVLALDAANTKSYPGSGTAWTDLSGNTNNGTLTNGPTFNSANGGSIVFDGADDTVVTTATPSTTQNFTISIWFNPNTLSTGVSHNVVYVSAESGNTLRLYKNTNFATNVLAWLLYFETTTGSVGVAIPSYTYTPNTWTNSVFAVGSTGTYKVYINGSIVSSQIGTNFSRWYLPNSNLILSNGGTFPGKIASLNIWQGELTSNEILQNYNAQKSRFNL